MTVSVDQRPTGATGRPRHRVLLALAVGAPLVLALVVAAGFTHPWNAGSGLAAGEYSRAYEVTRQVELPAMDRCLEITARGTMTARYNSPVWSLGGPGWTSPALSDTSLLLKSSQTCAGTPAPVDAAQLTQYWATETCAEPVRGDWHESTDLGRCDRDLVAGLQSGAFGEGTEFSSSISEIPALTWHGTTYGDAVCLDGAVSYSVTVGSDVTGGPADGLQVCLDPETAELA